jgi:hypothetical protein
MWPRDNPVQLSFLGRPAWGHQVEVSADVGATLHIEPNDIPQAGVPTDVWFALTAAGGTIIPLEQCDCALTVYDQTGTAIAAPPLTPTTAEGYENIPGSTVTFPIVGAYELVLAGEPGPAAASTAFELRFEVTVAGTAAPVPAPTVTSPTTVTSQTLQEPSAPVPSSPALWPWLIGGGTLAVVLVTFVGWRLLKGKL